MLRCDIDDIWFLNCGEYIKSWGKIKKISLLYVYIY